MNSEKRILYKNFLDLIRDGYFVYHLEAPPEMVKMGYHMNLVYMGLTEYEFISYYLLPAPFEATWHIRNIHKFLREVDPSDIYQPSQSIYQVFEFMKVANEAAEQMEEKGRKDSEGLLKKGAELLEIVGTDNLLKCFVDTLRYKYDSEDEVWNTYRLKTLFKNGG